MSDANTEQLNATGVAQVDETEGHEDEGDTPVHTSQSYDKEGQEDEGEPQKKEAKLRSGAWVHFTKLPVVPGKSPQCRCNYCRKLFTCGSKGGTTHLLRHMNEGKCFQYNLRKKGSHQTELSFRPPSCSVDVTEGEGSVLVPWKFDQEQSRKDMTELIIWRELPFNFVEDPKLRKFVRGVCPKYKFVTRNTMKNDCVKFYETKKSKLMQFLKREDPRVCLTTDTWTSANDLPFIAITAHFIDYEWRLHKRILNFVLVPTKASRENLADIIIGCLQDWSIERICTITMDNCSTNDVVARSLVEHYASKNLLVRRGQHLQVRCSAHILNLIVQQGLDEIKDSIIRVRNAVKYIKASPKRKLEFLRFADMERIPRTKMLVLDVCTRWNSTYKMLASALHYKEAYNRMKTRDPSFKEAPTQEDWDKASRVHDFLEVFFRATELFSGSKFCTANLFFCEVYKILLFLYKTCNNEDLILGNMSMSMLVKFNKYWIEKEPNMLLLIAVVLDPRYKLKYLRFCYKRIYEESEVTYIMGSVEDELRRLFDEYGAKYEKSCRTSTEICSKKRKEGSIASGSSYEMSLEFMNEFYKESEEEYMEQSKTELDVYLEEKLHCGQKGDKPIDFDILAWWKVNANKYPVLSMIARDILAIPISSVALESAFSTGGRVLSKFRSSLLPSTVEALICAQDWVRESVLEDDDDCEEVDVAFSAP